MKVDKIADGSSILAMVVRADDWEDGLNFVSRDKDYIQVGFWKYPKGQVLATHIHIISPREVLQTQEVLCVKKGRVKATIYTNKGTLVSSVELRENDTIILLTGGHGYEILEDGTQVVEIKNGPYIGPEKDRRRI